MCVGFWQVLVPPSPKFQDHPMIPPVELSVNETARGATPPVGDAEKFATGSGGLTFIVVALDDDPNEFETVRNTV